MKSFNGEELEIAYKQVSVFLSGIDAPFSDWTQTHVEQGFTFRSDSVGIMTFSESGSLKTGVDTSPEIIEEALRVIILPFEVNGGKGVEISTITGGYPVAINDGKYSLIIQLGSDQNNGSWCWFSFVRSEDLDATPRYLRTDKDIVRKVDFLLTASPA